jgi:membrane protein
MLWIVAKEAAENWSSHKDSRQGAALAYYSVFSLGPIIVIAIAIAGFFFGREAVSGQVASSIKDLLGDTGAKAVQAMLVDASRPREGLLATSLGLGALVFAAIGVVVQLKDALNTVWEVGEIPGHGLWHFARSYVLSFAGILALGFLLLVSLLVTTVLAVTGKYAAPYIQEWVLHLVSILVSFSVITLLFAMMFKWLPDTLIDWYDVWLGAILTATLFELGKSAIGFYIGKQGLESTYGAAASIIVVLIWVYYSSQIILMGAEVTHAFAKHKGSIKKREQSEGFSGEVCAERLHPDERAPKASGTGLSAARNG